MAMQSLAFFAALVCLVAASSIPSLDIGSWTLIMDVKQNISVSVNGVQQATLQNHVRLYKKDSTTADVDNAKALNYVQNKLASFKDLKVDMDNQLTYGERPSMNITMVEYHTESASNVTLAILAQILEYKGY